MSLITENYSVMTADVDERAIEASLKGLPAQEVAKGLGLAKARAVYESLSEEDKKDAVVIGADTSVIIDNLILGKPVDKDDARAMLTRLCGRKHSVITGVALITHNGEKVIAEESFVEFAAADEYQTNLIERYISTSDPYDKAGGYGIQGGGALLVKSVVGDYFNVVGMPVMKLARELHDMGAL